MPECGTADVKKRLHIFVTNSSACLESPVNSTNRPPTCMQSESVSHNPATNIITIPRQGIFKVDSGVGRIRRDRASIVDAPGQGWLWLSIAANETRTLFRYLHRQLP